MENKRINLFKKVDTYVQLDEKLRKINYYGIAISAVFLIAFLGLFSFNFVLNSQLTSLTQQKQSLSGQLEKTDTQFKINYISNKTAELKQYSQDDANFTAYYDILQNKLTPNGMPPLNSFVIDNKQNASFSFKVNSYQDMQNVVHYVESLDFTDLFSKLTMKNASYDISVGSPVITLEFTGVMKHVNQGI